MPIQPKQQPPYYEPGTTTPAIQPKKYIANMLQAGTAAPTATIFENTIGNIVWTYDSPGYYIGLLDNTFPTLKVACTISGIAGGSADLQRASDDYVQLATYDETGNFANGLMNGEGVTITILIYP